MNNQKTMYKQSQKTSVHPRTAVGSLRGFVRLSVHPILMGNRLQLLQMLYTVSTTNYKLTRKVAMGIWDPDLGRLWVRRATATKNPTINADKNINKQRAELLLCGLCRISKMY